MKLDMLMVLPLYWLGEYFCQLWNLLKKWITSNLNKTLVFEFSVHAGQKKKWSLFYQDILKINHMILYFFQNGRLGCQWGYSCNRTIHFKEEENLKCEGPSEKWNGKYM